jgi:2-oxoglutarate ferredoxin oxidoreductase subunit alpha
VAEGARKVLVYEVNAGQMLDDVRLSIPDRHKIEFIGGVSVDYSGMRQGDLLQVSAIRAAVQAAIDHDRARPAS